MEKAVCLANVLLARDRQEMRLLAAGDQVRLTQAGAEYLFPSHKNLHVSYSR
jgi:hypothetical protein